MAAVVDPRLDIDEYLRLARYLGVRIEHVLETHNHADHVSGHGRLVSATGARIHIHRDAGPDYDHEPRGAAASGRIPQRALGRGFAALVVAVAGGLLVSALAA